MINKILTKQKVLFLDRDGTLCWDKGAFHSHVCDYDELINNIEILPFVKDVLKIAKNKNYLLIVISNQAGVAKGQFKEEAIHRFNYNLNKKLDNMIDGFYYCIHHDKGNEKNGQILNEKKLVKELIFDCECRKPKIGMFINAENDLKNGQIQIVDENLFYTDDIYIKDRTKLKKKTIDSCIIDKSNSFMIGDKLLDTIAGKTFGIKSILLRTGEGLYEEKKLCDDFFNQKNNILDYVFDNMSNIIDLL